MGLGFSSSPSPMASEIKAKVEETINSNTVVIYSKPGCPYCKVARDVSYNILIYCYLYKVTTFI